MLKFIIALLLFTVVLPAKAAEALYLAAASDLVYCLPELNAAFLKSRAGAEIKVTTGSSGNFFAQIRNGGPFDIFLSADMKYPRELVKAGMADGESLTDYAVGRIVLWSMNPSVDVSRGLKVLGDPAVVKRIAIANPDHAPYGQAARAALQHEGMWDSVQTRLVVGENISQTAQFVQSGNADAGIVALALLKSPKLANVGKYYVIPLETFPRMEQGAVITRKGRDSALAKEYIGFLRGPAARAILNRYGFILPD